MKHYPGRLGRFANVICQFPAQMKIALPRDKVPRREWAPSEPLLNADILLQDHEIPFSLNIRFA